MSNKHFEITVGGTKMDLIIGQRYQFDISDGLPPIVGKVMDEHFLYDDTVFFYVWDDVDNEDYQVRETDVVKVTSL